MEMHLPSFPKVLLLLPLSFLVKVSLKKNQLVLGQTIRKKIYANMVCALGGQV